MTSYVKIRGQRSNELKLIVTLYLDISILEKVRKSPDMQKLMRHFFLNSTVQLQKLETEIQITCEYHLLISSTFCCLLLFYDRIIPRLQLHVEIWTSLSAPTYSRSLKQFSMGFFTSFNSKELGIVLIKLLQLKHVPWTLTPKLTRMSISADQHTSQCQNVMNRKLEPEVVLGKPTVPNDLYGQHTSDSLSISTWSRYFKSQIPPLKAE